MRNLARAYGTAAVIVLNTILALIVLNALLWAAFRIRESAPPAVPRDPAAATAQSPFGSDGGPLDNGRRSPYQRRWFDYTAYEGVADERYASTVLDDFWALGKRGFDYQPWIQFAEPRFDGELVHVDTDEYGFPLRRTTARAPAASGRQLRIFVLGGSTTFGYSVSDEHTWPSFLARILGERAGREGIGVTVEVRNYGRGYYNPSQEAVLLLDLLKTGHRPDLVIFMDGVNWGPDRDVPYLTQEFARRFDAAQGRGADSRPSAIDAIPMVRAAQWLLGTRAAPQAAPEQTAGGAHDPAMRVEQIVNRFRTGRLVATRICQLYGIPALFFLQPDPVYNYPEHLYRGALPPEFARERAARQAFYAVPGVTDGYTDLTGLFDAWGPARKAIVDDVHYSPRFNEFLAGQVAARVDLRALGRRDTSALGALGPTGPPRAAP